MHSASQSKLRFIYSGRTGIDSQTSLTANSIIRTKQRTFHSLTFRPSDPLSRSSTACIILLLSQVNSSHGKYNHERTSKRLCHSRIMKTMICGNTGSYQTKQWVATVKSGANKKKSAEWINVNAIKMKQWNNLLKKTCIFSTIPCVVYLSRMAFPPSRPTHKLKYSSHQAKK